MGNQSHCGAAVSIAFSHVEKAVVMKQKCWVVFAMCSGVVMPLTGFAQHQYAQAGTEEAAEVNAMLDVFDGAELEGHVRNYFMCTLNEGEAQDYYTNATGGAIGIETLPYKGFSAGVKGIFTYQTFSSDLNEADEQANAVSKWEHELYDINDLENYHDLDRLEELYLAYHAPKFSALLGKLPMPETNLVNRSDGRMKPFAYSGALFNWMPDSTTHVFAAGINRVSPRSTVEWYDFNEAIGIVTNGIHPDGTEAEYEGQSGSQGMLILGLDKEWKGAKHGATHSLSVYNYQIDRVINTTFLECREGRGPWEFAVQYAHQVPGPAQAALGYANRYVQPDERGQVGSASASFAYGGWRWRAALSHVFDTGRFLFPRELGRDHFTTSISRSRLEGVGHANVIMLEVGHEWSDHAFVEVQWTQVHQLDGGSHILNKYNFEDYRQVNVRFNHQLRGFYEGLEVALLFVHKQNVEPVELSTVFNRSNFDQLNLVVNCNF